MLIQQKDSNKRRLRLLLSSCGLHCLEMLHPRTLCGSYPLYRQCQPLSSFSRSYSVHFKWTSVCALLQQQDSNKSPLCSTMATCGCTQHVSQINTRLLLLDSFDDIVFEQLCRPPGMLVGTHTIPVMVSGHIFLFLLDPPTTNYESAEVRATSLISGRSVSAKEANAYCWTSILLRFSSMNLHGCDICDR